MPILQTNDSVHCRREGYLFEPTRQRHWFHYAYDPTANGGNGKITVKIDDDQFTLDVPPEIRNGPCNFDRFGIMNARGGGKVVQVYVDDLSYTARPPTNDQRHRRKVENVPYPDWGRRY